MTSNPRLQPDIHFAVDIFPYKKTELFQESCFKSKPPIVWAYQKTAVRRLFSFAVARQEIFIYFDFKESILLPNDFHLTYLNKKVAHTDLLGGTTFQIHMSI